MQAGLTETLDCSRCIPPPELRRIRHTETDATASVSFQAAPADSSDGDATPRALCVLRILRDVAQGEEITADLAPAGRRNLSRAVRLLTLLPASSWAAGREPAAAAVQAALAGPPLPGAPGAPRGSAEEAAAAPRRDGQAAEDSELPEPSKPVRVFTDYPLLAERLTDPSFEIAPEPAGIDVLWLIQPLRDFRRARVATASTGVVVFVGRSISAGAVSRASADQPHGPCAPYGPTMPASGAFPRVSS